MKRLLPAVLVAVSLLMFSGCGKSDERGKVSAHGNAVEERETRAVKEVSGKPLVTLVEIGSVRCIPCKMMQPVLEKVSAKYGKKVQVVFHDVWTKEGRPYGAKYGVRAIPTQVFLNKSGEEFFRHTGFFPFEKIEALLKSKGIN